VTVDCTHTELGQQVDVKQSLPGFVQVEEQYSGGAHTALVPAMRTVQHPELH